MITGLTKAKQAGLKISATVILGLGGQTHWQEHIDATADLVNQVELDYLSTLQLMLDPAIYQNFIASSVNRSRSRMTTHCWRNR